MNELWLIVIWFAAGVIVCALKYFKVIDIK